MGNITSYISPTISLILSGSRAILEVVTAVEQTYGMAMGSPFSPVLANLFMEEFEEKAIAEAPTPPKFWGRYVDDTGVVVLNKHEDELFQHINKQLT